MTDEEQKAFQATVDEYCKAKDELLAKFGLDEIAEIDFPNYKKLPPEVQLAIMVINQHGALNQIVVKKKDEVK
jgi:hypothetical protein